MDVTLAMLDDPRDEPRFARRVLLENDACATVGAHYGPGGKKRRTRSWKYFDNVLFRPLDASVLSTPLSSSRARFAKHT
jgi:hypothetical protein